MKKEITQDTIRKGLFRAYDSDHSTNRELGQALRASEEFRRVTEVLEKNNISVSEVHQDEYAPFSAQWEGPDSCSPCGRFYVHPNQDALKKIQEIKELDKLRLRYEPKPFTDTHHLTNATNFYPPSVIIISEETPPATGRMRKPSKDWPVRIK